MKMRKFEKGGFAFSEDSEANEDRLGDFIAGYNPSKNPGAPVAAPGMDKTDDELARTNPTISSKPKNFKAAFAEERSAGDKTFEFGGKKYTTDLAKPSVSVKRETTVEDVFPVLTGEKKRAEEKMDKKQFRAEQNAQIIAREGAKAKAAKDKETITPRRSGMSAMYASGGAVSASRRGDGIAQRGKTRGKMC